jgi:peptidyl-dipeptidase Dcp
MRKYMTAFLASGVIAAGTISTPASTGDAAFGPSNPFYAPSTLPFQAPLFDKIKDGDYQPAIEAGMAQELAEIEAIANNPAPPTFENTIVAMEKTGRLLQRVLAAFGGVTGANTNPVLQKVRADEAANLAAHQDAIVLNAKLFARRSTTTISFARAQIFRMPTRPS